MRLVTIICLLIFQLSLSTFLEVSNAVECRNGEGASKVAYTLTVSQSGGGNFTTVQDAVNAVPTGNDQWIRIFVNSGLYREQVKIPQDKECIVLEGQSEKETIITFDAYFQTVDSPTFVSMASNFVAKSITFKNTYNEEGERLMSKENKQAVAISVYGDKSGFHSCDFVGYQDTIWDVQGRHFFNSCYIEGAIDFIWGNGQSVYEDCQINVTGDGFITAQGRTAQTDPSGFVFIRGQVVGTGKAYLGRAYDAFSRVIYQFTSLSEVINPLGWNSWRFAARTADLTYAEVNCTGVGANNSSRVEWEKKLEASELTKYTREAFIDQDGWIAQQP